ncbi:MAG: glycosyltransferase family 39 protein [Acidimicrobiia bacterium]
MTMLTPVEEAALELRTRRTWRLDALVLGIVALLLRLPAFFAARSLVFDDGVFASSVFAMRRGDLPFRDVFSSQGALFLPLAWLGDLVGLRTINAPRVLAVAAGVLLTVATYSCARQLTTRSHALLAAALVTTSGSVLWVTGPLNADGPALALSVLAVAFALRYRRRPRHVDAVYVGIAAGAAMSIKAIAGPAVLVAGLVVVCSNHAFVKGLLDGALAASVGVAVVLVTALPWGIDRVWEQAFRYHTDATRQSNVTSALHKVLETLWARDLAVLVALALAAVFLVVRRHGEAGWWRPSLTVWMLGGWAALVVVLLVTEPALWRAHVAHLVVPLALLAALAPPPWRVLLVAAVVVVPVSVYQNHTILWPGGYSGTDAAVVARLHSLPDDALVISDDPGLVWRAERGVPGPFADASFLRIDAGELTASKVARAAQARDVCGVLVTSPDRYGRFTDLGDRLRAEGFFAEHFGDEVTFYARPGCEPS